MKFTYVLPIFLAVPQLAVAASATGTLIGGGGVDDMQVVVQTSSGQKINAYCDSQCGDWFEEDHEAEVYGLKKEFKGKKVSLEYAVEINGDRIVGPATDERLPFVKSIRFVR